MDCFSSVSILLYFHNTSFVLINENSHENVSDNLNIEIYNMYSFNIVIIEPLNSESP